MDYHEDPDTGPTHKEQAYIDQRDDALARAEKAEAAQLATKFAHDAAIALLRRLVVSIRLGSIDEAAVREAWKLVGESASPEAAKCLCTAPSGWWECPVHAQHGGSK